MTNNIEALAVAWELRTAIDGRTSQTIFATKATAEREAEAVRSSYGNHAFTRISPVTIRQGRAAP
jgi:hypothetical protein